MTPSMILFWHLFELEKSPCPTTLKQGEQQIDHPFIGLADYKEKRTKARVKLRIEFSVQCSDGQCNTRHHERKYTKHVIQANSVAL